MPFRALGAPFVPFFSNLPAFFKTDRSWRNRRNRQAKQGHPTFWGFRQFLDCRTAVSSFFALACGTRNFGCPLSSFPFVFLSSSFRLPRTPIAFPESETPRRKDAKVRITIFASLRSKFIASPNSRSLGSLQNRSDRISDFQRSRFLLRNLGSGPNQLII